MQIHLAFAIILLSKKETSQCFQFFLSSLVKAETRTLSSLNLAISSIEL